MAGLFDYEYQLEKINSHKPPLQKLNSVIDWEMFRTPIETALYVEPKAPGGRPPYDRLMMFKITILQQYYNLSDEQTEFQIKDRLSFMQFLGLQIGDDIPDANAIWNFKEGAIPLKFAKEDKNGHKSILAQKDTDARWMTKKSVFTDVSKDEIIMIQNRLNHRPRKALGYKTPYEVFFSEMARKLAS